MIVAKRDGKENPMEFGVHLPLLAFEERWTRFDEAIQLLRSLLKQPFWRSTEG